MKTKFIFFVVAIFVLLILLVSIGYIAEKQKRLFPSPLPLTPETRPQPTAPIGESAMEIPQGQATCEVAGGVWKQWGFLPELSCNIPTKDAGKPCRDSSQCEGPCIAVGDIIEDSSVTGVCHEWRRAIGGCFAFVEDGKTAGVICID